MTKLLTILTLALLLATPTLADDLFLTPGEFRQLLTEQAPQTPNAFVQHTDSRYRILSVGEARKLTTRFSGRIKVAPFQEAWDCDEAAIEFYTKVRRRTKRKQLYPPANAWLYCAKPYDHAFPVFAAENLEGFVDLYVVSVGDPTLRLAVDIGLSGCYFGHF